MTPVDMAPVRPSTRIVALNSTEMMVSSMAGEMVMSMS